MASVWATASVEDSLLALELTLNHALEDAEDINSDLVVNI